ncbi:L,D-transpeptidase [Devosia sp.]|uniref:L,D-transpeptidase n=1 Tax=Devosia sp. TaxID=1871048 RepID=UPI0019E88CAF|nr:L,D-transpeptidase [Devosia sp.]MBE0578252.1 L,D-transpeptidase [Devosia sp.]
MSSIVSASLPRRAVLAGLSSLGALALAGCATTASPPPVVPAGPVRHAVPPDVLAMYAARPEEDYPVPAADIAMIDPLYWRQEIDNPTGQAAGSVVVDTTSFFLYWTMPNGRAMHYGVGLGRAGFEWSGEGHIAYKRKWPVWTPPREMVDRQPELEIYRNGQPPGLLNALGARALYIHQGNRDTLYRVHGTMDVATIGKAVSSGCVRLLFQDVMDLYERVPSGSPILVI